MLSFVLGILIGLDHAIHHSTYLLIEFLVAFMSDGLMLLANWEIMEIVPETMTGRALGFATVCTSGIYDNVKLVTIGSHITYYNNYYYHALLFYRSKPCIFK